jgi:hypothetical protein
MSPGSRQALFELPPEFRVRHRRAAPLRAGGVPIAGRTPAQARSHLRGARGRLAYGLWASAPDGFGMVSRSPDRSLETAEPRRVDPRATVGLPAEIRRAKATGWEEVLLQDLSVGGAAVHTRSPLPSQTEVRIRFHLPGAVGGRETQVEIDCLVVRSGPLIPSDRGFVFSVGLHFLTLRGENFGRVRGFVWSSLEEASR